jgi:2-phosphosulfolactate phosphatase
VNIARVVDFTKDLKEDIIIVCAGNQSVAGGFSLEDMVCAGMIIHKVRQGSTRGTDLSDSASGALILYRSFARNISKMLEESEHGRKLVEIGFKDDLKTCSSIDSIPVLPLLSGNVIRLAQDSKTNE